MRRQNDECYSEGTAIFISMTLILAALCAVAIICATFNAIHKRAHATAHEGITATGTEASTSPPTE